MSCLLFVLFLYMLETETNETICKGEYVYCMNVRLRTEKNYGGLFTIYKSLEIPIIKSQFHLGSYQFSRLAMRRKNQGDSPYHHCRTLG